jgi:hypothetical protein
MSKQSNSAVQKDLSFTGLCTYLGGGEGGGGGGGH